MMGIETHTVIYLWDLLATRVAAQANGQPPAPTHWATAGARED